MGKLSRREWGIVFEFVLALVFITLAIVEFIRGGEHVLDFVELSFMALILSRVL